MKRKNGFLTFLCACCFGAGQMYLGMMKRGVSIMLAACLIFAVGGVLGISILLVLLPVVWFFAFFDTFNLRAMGVDAMPPQERAALDRWLLPGGADLPALRAVLRRRHVLVGALCILAGAYYLFENVVLYLFHWVFNFPAISIALGRIPALAGGALVVALGVYLVVGGRPRRGGDCGSGGDYIEYGGQEGRAPGAAETSPSQTAREKEDAPMETP